MATVSLCMIVKNEEDVLERCLNSIKKFADEIIIVDTGSTDKTKEIALKFTNKVFDFTWCNDFSLARNYSFSLATCEYIMWLDADDVIKPSQLKKLLSLKPNLCADTYMLKYATCFNKNTPSFIFYRERILKNNSNAVWQGCVHECITPYGIINRLNITVEHRKLKQEYSTRNIDIYTKTIKQRPLNPREMYYYGRELFDHKKYKKCVSVLNKFLASGLGWIENIIDAHFILALCHEQLNNHEKMLYFLLQSFEFDKPRANFCCKIGDYFLSKKIYDIAKYWYINATKCDDITTKGGFVDKNYSNYYPYLQLCICCYFLNDIKKAEYYNNKAGKFYPKSKAVKQNKIFFNSILKKN